MSMAAVVAAASPRDLLFADQTRFIEQLMRVYKELANAHHNLKQFECDKALKYLSLLPHTQLNSSFVLNHMAKAHFELHNYERAERVYTQLRREYPYHLDGLEYYSTTLWHLQKEIALSALAQELTEYDKLAPQTWCVVGNCFSLHKEHDAAIKFFQRATQCDPHFVFAYNLVESSAPLVTIVATAASLATTPSSDVHLRNDKRCRLCGHSDTGNGDRRVSVYKSSIF